MQQGWKVLDVGCDRKQLRGQLSDSVRYTGIDMSDSADLVLNLEGGVIPLGDRSHATVIAADVLEHVDAGDHVEGGVMERELLGPRDDEHAMMDREAAEERRDEPRLRIAGDPHGEPIRQRRRSRAEDDAQLAAQAEKRQEDPRLERVQRGIHLSINGIAAGLRNTG